MNLKQAAKQAAQQAAEQKRAWQRWLRERKEKTIHYAKVASAQNSIPPSALPVSQSDYAAAAEHDDLDDADWVVPLAVLKDAINATDKTVAMLKEIIDSGLIAGALLDSARSCATSAAKTVAGLRDEYGLTVFGKVINIRDHRS
jgi:hypothetical protein